MWMALCSKCQAFCIVEHVYGNEWAYWCTECKEWGWMEGKDLEERMIEAEGKWEEVKENENG